MEEKGKNEGELNEDEKNEETKVEKEERDEEKADVEKEEGKKGAKKEEISRCVLIIEIDGLVEEEKATEEEMEYVISEVERTQAKAKDDLGQMITYVSYRSSKVQMCGSCMMHTSMCE